MNQPTDTPLTKTHYTQINQALARLAQARLKIESAIRAGVPMDEFTRVADWYEEQLGKLKEEHFKGKP